MKSIILVVAVLALTGCASGPGVNFGVTVPGLGEVKLETTPFAVPLAAVNAATDAVGITTPPAK